MSGETELEIQRAVGRIEGQLDALVLEVRTANKQHISVSAALSKRITKVETWQTRMTAAGVVVGAIFGFLVKLIAPRIHQ